MIRQLLDNLEMLKEYSLPVARHKRSCLQKEMAIIAPFNRIRSHGFTVRYVLSQSWISETHEPPNSCPMNQRASSLSVCVGAIGGMFTEMPDSMESSQEKKADSP